MKNQEISKIYDILNTKHWMWKVYKKELKSGETLLTFFKKKFPELNHDDWQERFEWGGIFINGRPVTSDVILSAPCKIEYFEPKLPLAEMAHLYPPFLPEKHLLFEDDDLLVAFKPAGLPSKPAKEQSKFSLLRSLEDYTGRKLHMPSRLDVATAGVIIVSKSRRSHIALQQMFERRSIHKYYLLEVSGKTVDATFTVDKPIGRDLRHPVLRKVTTPEDGKSAITKFTRLYETPHGTTILQAEPLTGRTHQIRVHSAFAGFPLLGDTFYAGAAAPTLHLLSYKLSIIHPFSRTPLEVSVPETLLPDWLLPPFNTR